ncbi:MAG: DUF5696 domain-containing protein [Verrucomicrobiia bacterium]|jgi:hypothetical protein
MTRSLVFSLATFVGVALFGAALSAEDEVASARTQAKLDTATVEIKKLDGSVLKKTVKLEKTDFGAMRFYMPIREISRDFDTIDVVADWGRAKKGEAGFFVLPDGSYGTFRCGKGGYEVPWRPMPIYGMKNPRGCFVAIVKGLSLEQRAFVRVKNGEYETGALFKIKDICFDAYEDIVIDFYPLAGKDQSYAGMAKVYRKYQLDRGEVVPLRERVKNNPQLAYTADTMFVRVKHGVKETGNPKEAQAKWATQAPEHEAPLKVAITFDRFMEIMKTCKKLGMNKLEVCSVGWNIRGHDGRFPQLFPVEPAFGGEAKFKASIDLAHQLGYQIVCHINQSAAFTVSDRWNEAHIAKRADDSLAADYMQAGGMAYNPCFKCVHDLWMPEDFKRLSTLGIKGTFHIDVTSCVPPYVCCDPRHPLNRKQTAEYQNKCNTEAKRVFGGVGSEGPVDHVAKNLDYALYVWGWPSWLGTKNDLTDRLVPIWQLVYHGIILSNPYYGTIDYTIPRAVNLKVNGFPWFTLNDADRRLKVYEFGGRPTFYFINYADAQLPLIKKAYDEYQPVKYLQYEFMDDHCELAKDVYITVYSDGSEIVSNYSESDFSYKGETMKPKDFKLFKPSAKAVKN